MTRRGGLLALAGALTLAGCPSSHPHHPPEPPPATDDRPAWPPGAALRAGPEVDGRVTVWWVGAFDADGVVAYRLMRGDQVLAQVPGAVTSAVLPAGDARPPLAVWAVDAQGHLSPAPLTLR